MKYKAIALDLDGTLTNSEKKITPRTLKALKEAQKRGVTVILASGRPTYGIVPVAKEVGIADFGGYILAFNGGRITRFSDGEVVFNQTLDPAFLGELHSGAMRHGMHILSPIGDKVVATNPDDQYVQVECNINHMPAVKYNDFVGDIDEPINKCLIVGDPERLPQVEEDMKARLGGKMDFYRSCPFFLECVPLGIDKAASLARLCEIMGIGMHEMIACGDSYNDMSMIKAAGLGVAMANSAPEVLEAADHVTLSNDEDGVAVVIEKFILGEE